MTHSTKDFFRQVEPPSGGLFRLRLQLFAHQKAVVTLRKIRVFAFASIAASPMLLFVTQWEKGAREQNEFRSALVDALKTRELRSGEEAFVEVAQDSTTPVAVERITVKSPSVIYYRVAQLHD